MEIYGADIRGIEGRLITCRIRAEEGRRGATLLGLAQKVVKEGVVRAAGAIQSLDGNWGGLLKTSGYTIQLSPDEEPKWSSGLDLPIAIMLLQAGLFGIIKALDAEIEGQKKRLEDPKASRLSPQDRSQARERLGELSERMIRLVKYQKRLASNTSKYLLIGRLDITSGKIDTPTHGMLSMIAAAKPGFTVIVPEESESHAALGALKTQNIRACIAANLQEVWNVVLGIERPRKAWPKRNLVPKVGTSRYVPNLQAIDGLFRAKLAMEVALAGGHNILLVGPAGDGKTMLAEAASKLMPKLTSNEILELNRIYSAAGELNDNEIVLERPYRSASVGITPAKLFGGGRRVARPGLISLAHKGILLFDEINLFQPSQIESLRTPLSQGIYRVQRLERAGGSAEFPCNFILVATMNPCRCGDYLHFKCSECGRVIFGRGTKCPDHPGQQMIWKCKCTQSDIEKYQRKISKPILDRIDLKVFVSAVDGEPPGHNYTSRFVKRRICRAREMQQTRYRDSEHIKCNGDVPDRSQLREKLPDRVEEHFKRFCAQSDLSRRTQVKLLLVARTVADLEGSPSTRNKDIDKAAVLMGLRNPYFKNLQ